MIKLYMKNSNMYKIGVALTLKIQQAITWYSRKNCYRIIELAKIKFTIKNLERSAVVEFIQRLADNPQNGFKIILWIFGEAIFVLI